jgi:hypothetical protein
MIKVELLSLISYLMYYSIDLQPFVNELCHFSTIVFSVHWVIEQNEKENQPSDAGSGHQTMERPQQVSFDTKINLISFA